MTRIQTSRVTPESLDGSGLSIAIVCSRFNDHIVGATCDDTRSTTSRP